MHRRALLGALLAAPWSPAQAAGAQAAQAQAAQAQAAGFPSQPIRILSCDDHGGRVHRMAQLLAEALHGNSNLDVQVERRSLTGDHAALREAAQARPDGHTLLMTRGDVLTGRKWLFGQAMPLDPLRAFHPITRTGGTPLVLATPHNHPWQDIRHMLDNCRQHPDQFICAVAEPGSPSHLMLVQLQKSAGIQLRSRYFPDMLFALRALVAGTVDSLICDVTMLQPYLAGQQARAIALCSAAPLHYTPELRAVPTVQSILPGHDINAINWFGVMAPAGTPEDRIRILHRLIGHAMVAPSLQRSLLDLGILPETDVSWRAFATFLRREEQRSRAMVEQAGLLGALAE